MHGAVSSTESSGLFQTPAKSTRHRRTEKNIKRTLHPRRFAVLVPADATKGLARDAVGIAEPVLARLRGADLRCSCDRQRAACGRLGRRIARDLSRLWGLAGRSSGRAALRLALGPRARACGVGAAPVDAFPASFGRSGARLLPRRLCRSTPGGRRARDGGGSVASWWSGWGGLRGVAFVADGVAAAAARGRDRRRAVPDPAPLAAGRGPGGRDILRDQVAGFRKAFGGSDRPAPHGLAAGPSALPGRTARLLERCLGWSFRWGR